MGVIRSDNTRLHSVYLFNLLRQERFNAFLRNQIAGANINNLSAEILYNFQIPLPPLDVQHEIVAEIEGYQRVIDGARAVLDSYRPYVPVDPSWPLVRLGEISSKPAYGSGASKAVYDGKVRYVRITDLQTQAS